MRFYAGVSCLITVLQIFALKKVKIFVKNSDQSYQHNVSEEGMFVLVFFCLGFQ